MCVDRAEQIARLEIMSDLQRAIEIAVEAHRGQTQKCGAPYVLHPLHVMQSLTGEAERIAAVLHDVVEDTDVTLEDLGKEGFAAEIVEAVGLLTHDDADGYDEYVDRLRGNPIARRVKIADLEHNMDIRRLDEVRDKDLERLRKYHRVWKKLKGQ
jgi:(p)ppGpp synthase/HD superfamily hydrolase